MREHLPDPVRFSLEDNEEQGGTQLYFFRRYHDSATVVYKVAVKDGKVTSLLKEVYHGHGSRLARLVPQDSPRPSARRSARPLPRAAAPATAPCSARSRGCGTDGGALRLAYHIRKLPSGKRRTDWLET
jgi:hypothetical protein